MAIVCVMAAGEPCCVQGHGQQQGKGSAQGTGVPEEGTGTASQQGSHICSFCFWTLTSLMCFLCLSIITVKHRGVSDAALK